ncbi:hypothetical protein [sulfur-oxidizing endosymbiont of Gigantopelta aegis]|uniref:hypothetical protein n=1 Tax=sulfur-oxidizing endosymbiont of Gigantopelta aegis TaxID=2794934 RepID=UPI0018DD1063|nr:hypothetical protein [sulfur-oxidizing endosymbiont of Gigantopelta aegis]
MFNKIFDIIYLPSLELADFMGEKERSKYEVLLPGCDTPKINEISPLAPKKNIQSKITLLYSGGISPPLNDISLMLDLIGGRDNIHLIIIIRKNEWDKYGSYYQWNFLNVDVIVGKDKNQLHEYYAISDACLMLYPSHSYRYLAMPYKAFEAVGFGVPLLSFSDCVMGDFIKKNKLGLSMNYEEFLQSFSHTSELLNKLQKCSNNVLCYANDNTWEHRVRQIVKDFDKKLK